MLICHKIRSLRGERGKTRCHCERNGMERGNLTKGTRIKQIASAKTPRNDGREKQIASLRSQ